MAESDLSSVQKAIIGSSSSTDVNIQAASILATLNGLNLSFNIGGSNMTVVGTYDIQGTTGTSGSIPTTPAHDFYIVLIKPQSSSDIEMHLMAKTGDGSYTCCYSHQNNGDNVPTRVRIYYNSSWISRQMIYSTNRASWIRIMCVSAPGLFTA